MLEERLRAGYGKSKGKNSLAHVKICVRPLRNLLMEPFLYSLRSEKDV